MTAQSTNLLFPLTDKTKWEQKIAPTFDTIVTSSVNGTETRQSRIAHAIYQINLSKIEGLVREVYIDDLALFLNFFEVHRGKLKSFLYNFDLNNRVVNGEIGVGDGVTRTFQLQRVVTIESEKYSEPTKNINEITAIKVDGVEVSYSVQSTGLVTLASAPHQGEVITADFTFYFRMRFDTDKLSGDRIVELLLNHADIQLIGATWWET